MSIKTLSPFVDLQAQQKLIADDIKAALMRVLNHGAYILGPEVLELEQKLANFCGAKYAVSCANGTDSLMMIMMAKNLCTKDAVFVPSFTFIATAETVVTAGAQPIFVEVCPKSFNLDVESLKRGIKIAKENGLNPRGIMPVDLFGQPADYDKILEVAQENNLWVLCDAAQSFGASYKNKKVGSIGGFATSTSFFPAKPLGCYGDGGCIFTDSEELATTLRSLRMHGAGKERYDTIHVGINSRLDTIQAAILLEKLKIFPKEIEQRQEVANKYNSILKGLVETPFVAEGNQSAWAQYTVKLYSNQNRQEIQNKLKEHGIPTAIYYPVPIHQQVPYKKYLASETLKTTEALAKSVLSLPMHPYLEFSEDYIEKLRSAFI